MRDLSRGSLDSEMVRTGLNYRSPLASYLGLNKEKRKRKKQTQSCRMFIERHIVHLSIWAWEKPASEVNLYREF